MKNKLFLPVLLLLAAAPLLFAQNPEVFAPFVSRLKAAVRGPQIKLTWRDSPDVEGVYLVYRHTRDITSETFKEAALVARVAAGVEFYIDSPNEKGEFYYAVVTSAEGKVFDVFIPFRNKTSKGIAVESTMAEKDLAAVITDIDARAEADKIIVTYKASRADRELLLYRSTSPILDPDRLGPAASARSMKSLNTRIFDYPVPGIPYYYAIVDAKLLETGPPPLVRGQSASVSAAEIPLQKENLPVRVFQEPETASKRPLPLPYLILSGAVSGDGELKGRAVVVPAPRRILPETAKAVAAVVAKTAAPAAPRMEPYVLETDKALGSSKEDYTLKTILGGSFREKNWEETEKLLTHYMSIGLSEDALARALFYRAQALFFQEKYPESFMEFLLAKDRYYTEVRPWLDAILRLRRIKADPSGG